MSRLWSDHVAELSPYVPGEQAKLDKLLKLNTNEHPFGPSPRVLEAIRQAATDDLRLYPSYSAQELREAVAQVHGVQPANVFLGNGSDEVLAHVFSALFMRGVRPVLLPDVTYSFYTTYCSYFGVPADVVPLREDFTLDVQDYVRERTLKPAGIIFANPNAPTGIPLGLDKVEAILAANPDTAVVVDEAYVDFGGESAVGLLARYDNLVVIQTMSKSRALAGLRVGYALASADVIQALERVKDSFNSYPLDTLAQAGALASLRDPDYFQRQCQAVIDAREQLRGELEQMGFQVLPSKTNFLMATHPAHPASGIQQALREQGILVRHFRQPRIDQYLRITVGSPEQCARLCASLRQILEQGVK